MHAPCPICILVWATAIERSRLSAKSQWEEICFSVYKGVSESKDINVKTEIRFSVWKISLLKLLANSKERHNVSLKPYCTTKHPRFFFSLSVHSSSCGLMAVVEVVSVLTLMLILGVKRIQLTVQCTEGELRILSLSTNGCAMVFISVSPA